nr:non-ribosomal peptide synthetase [uncultured Cupriavidus sp.]
MSFSVAPVSEVPFTPADLATAMRAWRADGLRMRLRDGRWRIAEPCAASAETLAAAQACVAAHDAVVQAWLAEHPGFFACHPAGAAQLAMLAFHRQHPGSAAYNMAFSMELRHVPDVELLLAAARHVVDCHEALHSGFIELDGEIVMARPTGFAADVCATRVEDWSEAQAAAWLEREADEPFDVEAGHVCRFHLLVSQQSDASQRVWLGAAMHHIAGDFMGFELVVDQIMATFEAMRDGAAPMASQVGRYHDWLVGQRRLLAGPRGETLRAYWETQLEDHPAPPALPPDLFPVGEAQCRGEEIEFWLTPAQTSALRALAAQLSVSPFVVVLALYKTVLYRASGSDTFLIGTPTGGRSGAQYADLIGYTLNAVPLRADFSANPAFDAVVRDCARQMRGALRHQQYPMAQMGATRDAQATGPRAPLFRHMTTFVPVGPRTTLKRYMAREHIATQRGAANEMNLRWQDAGDTWRGQWRYDVDRFTRATVERLITAMRAAIDAVTADPEIRVAGLNLFPEALLSSAHTPAVQTFDTALAAFEHAAHHTPERTAVVAPDGTLSYAALDRKAVGIAQALQDGGVVHGDIVGLLMPRGAAMAASMLAAWKAGAAFLCLDSAMPVARLAQLCADANVRVVLGQGERPAWLGVASWLNPDAAGHASTAISQPVGAAHAAYLIYTSGSTGTPKAVAVSQGNLAHYAAGVLHALALPETATLAALSSVTADLGYTAWFGALLGGRTLRILDDALTEDPEGLAAALQAEPVDCLKIVPSHYKALLAVANPGRIVPRHCIVFGGEALDPALVGTVQALSAACRVFNHYGPTETTVGCVAAPAEPAAGAASIPVGVPLPGVTVHVLDAHGNRLPRGAAGELYVGGAGVALGYLHRAAQTAERFVSDRFGADGSRLYRTGDRVRMLHDGRLVFLGRADAQVKIRGFRVEPGEVEAWLRQAPQVRDAVVVTRTAPTGGLQLVAHIVTAGPSDVDALRAAMTQAMPAAMVPSAFVSCDAFPLLRNGKVDRKALSLREDQPARPASIDSADSPTVKALRGLWATVLGQDEAAIGTDANFFALGGDSILGLQLTARARQQGLALTPKLLFAHPTPAALAAVLDSVPGATRPAEKPGAELEAALHGIWCEVLRRDAIDRDADFFALGGDSILALQIVAKARARKIVLMPKTLFAHPTLARLAAHLVAQLVAQTPAQATPQPELPPFSLGGLQQADIARLRELRGDIEDAYPLSPLQEGLLFHHLRDGSDGAYVNQLVLAVDGPLDPVRMGAAWQAVLDAHPILRTSFVPAGEVNGSDLALQCVHRRVALPVSTEDWRAVPSDDAARRLEEWCRTDRAQGFDPFTPPLMRLALLRVADTRWWLVWSRHHLVVDGWGSVQLLDEALQRYADATHTATPRRPYRDYIAWTAQQPQAPTREFWQQAFAGLEGPTHLPGIADAAADAPAAKVPPLTRDLVVPPELDQSLRAFAARHRVTLNTVMQAAWSLVLARHAGTADVVFGVTSAGRPAGLAGADRMLGVFINTLPLRVRTHGAQSVGELLRGIQDNGAAMREFEHVALADIQAQSGVGGNLFDTLLVFQNLPDLNDRARQVAGLSLRQHDNIEQTHYGLTIEVMPDQRFVVRFTADGGRVAMGQLDQWVDAYRNVLAALSQGATHVGEVAMLAPERRQQLLDWGSSDDRTVTTEALQDDYLSRAAAWVAQHPERVLARCGSATLTYGEWWRGAGELAAALRETGVRADDTVAVLLPRGLQWLTALAGILRAGAAWVPLDVTHPPARWRQVVSQARPAQVLTDAAGQAMLDANALEGGRDVAALIAAHAGKSFTDAPRHPEGLAYVLFTSGSTGTPKGAMVTRAGMLNNMLAKVQPLGLGEHDTIAQTAPPCFDISVWQALAAPIFGASVDIVPDDVVRDVPALLARLAASGITLFEPVPSLLQALLDVQEAGAVHTPLPALRWVLPTGEALPANTARAWFQHYPAVPLMNAYGPAECADDVAFHPLHAMSGSGEFAVPIGRPTANARLQVLDADGNLAPAGAVGEIAVCGVGVGRGYLADARRTAAAFVPDPEGAPGQRRYLTGDLGRWRADGLLEYVGRKDFQVKLRGFRIELGEIEAVLAAQPTVRQALVTVQRVNGAEVLTAYWQPADAGFDGADALPGAVAASLPAYMVPAAWVRIEQWPLNANGKIDRKALPLPQQDHAAGQGGAPRTATERDVADVWEALLDGVQAGRESHFFQLGGHSLVATRVVARLRTRGYPHATLRDVFEAPTLAAFAARLDGSDAHVTAMPSLVAVPRRPAMAVSLAQQRLWLVEQLQGQASGAYNMAGALRLRGDLDTGALQASLNAVIARHEVLRTAYADHDGEPVAQIVPELTLPLHTIDLGPLTPSAQQAALQQAMREHAAKPFALDQAPLIRASLLRMGPGEHVLLVALHHLVSDGWSIGLFMNELTHGYAHARDPRAVPAMVPLPIQYADYAAWQRQAMQGARLETMQQYWRQALDGAPRALDLPADRPRPAVAQHDGGAIALHVDAARMARVETLARSAGVTPFTVLLATFQHWLHDATGMDDLVIGTDVAGRPDAALESLLGFFVNVLPLRSRRIAGASFNDNLRDCGKAVLDAFEHEALPFDRIVEAVGVPRDRSRNPLVQALFVLQNTPAGQLAMPGIEAAMLPPVARTSKFDMALFLEPEAVAKSGTVSPLRGEWVFATSLFDTATVERFAAGWLATLDALLASPDQAVSAVIASAPRGAGASRIPSENQESRSMETTQRMAAKLDQLRSLSRPRTVAPAAAASTLAANPALPDPASQVVLRPLSVERPFPLVIEPAVPGLDAAQWAARARPFITETLHRHAGLLFRNFDIATPQAFEAFAEAIHPGLYGSYGDLPKKEGGTNTYRSTPYPERQMILYHNESAHMDRWPRKQWFFCELPSPVGGATPIVDCRELLRRLPADLAEAFERKQLMYVRTFTPRLDVDWRDFYKTDDRAEVEARCRAAGIDCRWLDGDILQTRTVCPAVIRHPATGERSFFNQVQLHHVSCLEADVREDLLDMVGLERMPRHVMFGDGTPIPDDAMALVGELYEACAVRFEWLRGDVVMLDNMLAAHARDPYEGPRKIVVAMGDMFDRQQLAATQVAQASENANA